MDIVLTYIYTTFVLLLFATLAIALNLRVILDKLTIRWMNLSGKHPVLYSIDNKDGKMVDFIRDIGQENKVESDGSTANGTKIQGAYYKFDPAAKFCVFNDTYGVPQNFFVKGITQAIPIRDIKMDLRFDSEQFWMMLKKAFLHGRLSIQIDEKLLQKLLWYAIGGIGINFVVSLYLIYSNYKLQGIIAAAIPAKG